MVGNRFNAHTVKLEQQIWHSNSSGEELCFYGRTPVIAKGRHSEGPLWYRFRVLGLELGLAIGGPSLWRTQTEQGPVTLGCVPKFLGPQRTPTWYDI